MAGTPEEDLLAWLEREEVIHSFSEVADALTDIGKARELFYKELGYDINEEQFIGLTHASYTRYEELPSIGITYFRFEHKYGYQDTYRDVITGRFVKREDVFSLLATIR